MCNDFGNYVDYDDYRAAFSQTRIPVKWPNAIPNLQPRDDIWPTDRAVVIRRLEDETNEFSEIRWGFPPARRRGHQLSISALRDAAFLLGDASYRPHSSMSLRGPSRRRPSGASRKTGDEWFCFAGLWRPMPEGGDAFTLLTTDSSPDVAPIHDRQMVILGRENWSAWLQKTDNEKELLRALPAGSLEVDQVRA